MTTTPNTLGDLIRQARESALSDSGGRPTQEKVASHLGMSKQALSAIERGNSAPSFETLLRLFRHLVGDEDEQELRRWLHGLVAVHARSASTQLHDERFARLLEQVLTAVESEDSTNRGRRSEVEGHSLAIFPDGFEPLKIVVGDRRQRGLERSNSDLFVSSLSSLDVAYITHAVRNCVNPPEIVTDKIIGYMDDTQLRAELGDYNLLIIGAPATNLFTRMLNRTSIFRWDLPPRLYDLEHTLRTDERLRDDRIAQLVWAIAESITPDSTSELPDDINELRARYTEYTKKKQITDDNMRWAFDVAHRFVGGENARNVEAMFRSPGIVDPADLLPHAQFTQTNNDFGMLSLSKHPFSNNDERVAILAGGKHGPGTCHAVRALGGDTLSFEERPLGGVFEVMLDPRASWSRRVLDARSGWQTKAPYSIQQIHANYSKALDSEQDLFSNSSQEDLKQTVDFIEALMRKEATL